MTELKAGLILAAFLIYTAGIAWAWYAIRNPVVKS